MHQKSMEVSSAGTTAHQWTDLGEECRDYCIRCCALDPTCHGEFTAPGFPSRSSSDGYKV